MITVCIVFPPRKTVQIWIWRRQANSNERAVSTTHNCDFKVIYCPTKHSFNFYYFGQNYRNVQNDWNIVTEIWERIYLNPISFGIGTFERMQAASSLLSEGPTNLACPLGSISIFWCLKQNIIWCKIRWFCNQDKRNNCKTGKEWAQKQGSGIENDRCIRFH